MPGIITTIGGDARQLKQEMVAAQVFARKAGRQISADLNGGRGGSGGHGGGATSGIVVETLVLMRELGRGNTSRIPGSLTILAQRMGLLKYVIKDTALAAEKYADAWEKLAGGARANAFLRFTKIGDEKSRMMLRNAEAMEKTALKARQVADAERAIAGESIAAVGPIGIIGGVILGLAAGMFAAYKFAGALKDRLTGFVLPEFKTDYIAKRLQGSNEQAESERKITNELLKQADAYNSAAAAAERTAVATGKHFDHLRKMNELDKTKTPRQKILDEQKINQQERAAVLADKAKAKTDMEAEAAKKKAEADAISVTSEQHDQEMVKKAKADAEAGREYLAEQTASNAPGVATTMLGLDPSNWNGKNALRALNKMSLSGVSDADLVAADKKAKAAAQQAEIDEKAAINKKAENDLLRERKETLRKQEEAAKASAQKTGLEIGTLTKTGAQATKDEAEETRLKLMAGQSGPNNLNALQKIGAFTAGGNTQLLDVTKQMNQKLGILVGHTAKGGVPWNGAKY